MELTSRESDEALGNSTCHNTVLTSQSDENLPENGIQRPEELLQCIGPMRWVGPYICTLQQAQLQHVHCGICATD